MKLHPLTPQRIPAVVDLHERAFVGYMNTRMGSGYLRAFFRWFSTDPTAVALCSESDEGTVTGYVVGAPLDYGEALSKTLMLPAALGIGLRPWLFFDAQFRATIACRVRGIFGKAPVDEQDEELALPEPIYALVGIAVHPTATGQGLGSALMRAFEEKARACGAGSLFLSVYAENEAAIRMYERAGWEPAPISESHSGALPYVKRLRPDA